MDTRLYDIQFPNGSIEKLTANRIAMNLYASVDEYRYRHSKVQRITGHQSGPDAIPKSKSHVTDKNGKQHRRKTTKGWELKIEWADNSCSWMPLVDIKEAVPVEVSEYAKANKIDTEPAFAWWVPYTLKKRDHIISAVNKSVKITHTKYGIRVPKNRRKALAIDQENGDNAWSDAIKKEMQNIAPAFKIMIIRTYVIH